MVEWWWAYPAPGAVVGFFSGLLGIGGGAAMVPILAFIFAAKQFAPASVVHLALGTAIATMVFTAASSARSHHRHGGVFPLEAAGVRAGREARSSFPASR